MMRISLCLACLFAAFLFTTDVSSTHAKSPNVLLIAIDDLNDWVGALEGHPQSVTPNIDLLAARGVNFTNAHCQAPICNPSRVSMFLGKLPSTTGMYFLAPNFRTAEQTKDSETLFQALRRAGYYTSTCGKIFHGPADKRSFDHIEPSRGWRRSDEKLNYRLKGSHPLWDWGQVDVPDPEQRDYRTAAWGQQEIRRLATEEQPFCLAIGFHLPHVPIYASKKWFDLHPIEKLIMPETLSTDRNDLPEIAKQLTENPTAPRDDWMKDNDQSKLAVQAYLASVSFIDSLVGMLLSELQSTDAVDDTIVILLSDHGFHMGEKQRWAKRTLWEETTRVPLIFSGPGIGAGAACAQPVGLIDIFPTLADLCSLSPREQLDGQSLQPLLTDVTAQWPRPALCTFGPGNHSLRSQRWRYTVYADGAQELYDHATDPHEWSNLVAEQPSGEHRRVISEMQRWLPAEDAPPLPGSAGSDSSLYGEGGDVSLQKAMQRAAKKRK